MAVSTDVSRSGAAAATEEGAPMSLLGLPPAPEPRRRNTVVVGALFAVAAGIMLLAGVLASYFAAREATTGAGEEWLGADLPNVPLVVAYGTLLMSMVTAQWAVAAVKIGERRQLYLAVGITILLGLAFVNALSFSWDVLGLAAGESAVANAMYLVTVTHLLMVVAAVAVFVVMGFRALGGQLSPRNSEFVAAAAIVWHFVALAGVVVWWCVWFLEGGPGST
ncbi:MAG TPA: cytochrome c oxidase subunit 3 [Acidimicrobiales bacterium]|nr:cytochrome c oxidase subunit 3 [Acidimicrobiales bacterium]